MKVLQILSFALAVYTAQACRHDCHAYCAAEIKDPSKKLTLYRKRDLWRLNKNFEGDERMKLKFY